MVKNIKFVRNEMLDAREEVAKEIGINKEEISLTSVKIEVFGDKHKYDIEYENYNDIRPEVSD